MYTIGIKNWKQSTGFKISSTEGSFSYHSFFNLIRFKYSVVQHDAATKVICLPGATYLQYVGDNTDHDIATTFDENTHQDLGRIAIDRGRFSNLDTRRTPLPRKKKQ